MCPSLVRINAPGPLGHMSGTTDDPVIALTFLPPSGVNTEYYGLRALADLISVPKARGR